MQSGGHELESHQVWDIFQKIPILGVYLWDAEAYIYICY